MMRAPVWLTIIMLLLTGCQQDNGQKRPYMVGGINKSEPPVHSPYARAVEDKATRIERAKIEADTQERIARIQMERDIALEQLKGNVDVTKAGLEKDVALEEVDVKRASLEQELGYDMIKLYIIGSTILLLFLFFIWHTMKNRHARLRMQENELSAKVQMKEQEMKIELATRVLETISTGKLAPEQESQLIDTLGAAVNKEAPPQHRLEYKS